MFYNTKIKKNKFFSNKRALNQKDNNNSLFTNIYSKKSDKSRLSFFVGLPVPFSLFN